jgi:hypothetical protein
VDGTAADNTLLKERHTMEGKSIEEQHDPFNEETSTNDL